MSGVKKAADAQNPPHTDANTDTLTVLTVEGRSLATKRIHVHANGSWEITPYERAKYFRVEDRSVEHIKALHSVLASLTNEPQKLVIRGALKPELRSHVVRRKKGVIFDEVPRHWAMLDFDKVDAPFWVDLYDDPEPAIEWLIHEYLPAAFHDVSCSWQLSSSAGKPGVGNVLSAHIWFWFDQPVWGDELAAYFGARSTKVDPALFRTVQPHYTAAPVFDNGHDPLPRRSGFMLREHDEVTLPPINSAALKAAVKASGEGWGLLRGAQGIEGKLALLGDGDGLCGFHEPVRDAIMAYVGETPDDRLDTDILKARLRAAIKAAPKGPSRDVTRYLSNEHLDASIRGAQERRGPLSRIGLPEVELSTMVSLSEGAALIRKAVAGVVEEAMAFVPYVGENILLQATSFAPALLILCSAGVGKSHEAFTSIAAVLDRLADGESVLYLTPTHKLSREQAQDARKHGIESVEVFYGREAPDPTREGQTMCSDPRLPRTARSAGVRAGDACKACPLRHACAYQAQFEKKAKLWIAAHPVMFNKLPACMGKVRFIVIDEDFSAAGIVKNEAITLASLASTKLEALKNPADRDRIIDLRRRLLSVLDALPTNSKLTTQALIDAGISEDSAHWAKQTEWALAPASISMPDDVAGQIAAYEAHAGRFNRRLPVLWEHVERALLQGDATVSGLTVDHEATGIDGNTPRAIMSYRKELRGVDHRAVPTIMLDATARIEVVRQYLPHATIACEVHIEAPHQRVTYVRGKFSKRRLIGTVSAREGLKQFIEVQAAAFRGDGSDGIDVLVVANKAVEDQLKAGQLPANVAVEHFNNLRGVNQYSGVRALIAVNKTLPRQETLARDAEALAGRSSWGKDPLLDDVRWLTCEAELIQVIGRARGVRRTAENPVDVFVLNDDWRLPVTVDQATEWMDVAPHPLDVMAARGVILDCDTSTKGAWSLIRHVLPDMYPSKDAARMAMPPREGFPYSYLYRHPSRQVWFRGRVQPKDCKYSVPVLVASDCRTSFKWTTPPQPGFLLTTVLSPTEPGRATFVPRRSILIMGERYASTRQQGLSSNDCTVLSSSTRD